MDKVVAGMVFDVNGQKHGSTDSDTFDSNTTIYVDEMKATSVGLDTAGKKDYVNMGHFDFECISDPDRCDPHGITISMFIFVDDGVSGTVVYLATAEPANGRGIVVKYDSSTNHLYIQVFTSTKKDKYLSSDGESDP